MSSFNGGKAMIRQIISVLILSLTLNVQSQQFWIKSSTNPIELDAPYAVVGMSDPTLYFDGSSYHLWISGGGFVPNNPNPSVRTGYYTSTDFLNWIPAPDNPVLREGPAGTWDSAHIETPHIFKNGSEFWLYYCATPDTAPDDAETLQFGLATSEDGANWVRHEANPILSRGPAGAWDGFWIESPCILKVGSTYMMWYNGIDRGWRIHIGLATSQDGINWTKHENNPVFSPDPNIEWRSIATYAPQVRYIDGRYLMLFTGMRLGETTYDFYNMKTGLAVSTDGIHWECLENPVLEGTPDAWDSPGPFTLDWIQDGDSLRMFYTSDGFGTAVSSKIPAKVQTGAYSTSIKNMELKAFPSPFNSQLRIQYQLSEAEQMKIDIVDIFGRVVNVLIEGYAPAGNHRISWAGHSQNSNLCGNGIYFIRLQTRNRTVIKRIVLLK